MSSSAPEAPDYAAAAEKTAASDKETLTQQTWANRATQNNPWGQVSWQNEAAVDPATGQKVTQWTQNTTLDPRLQQALDSQIGIQQQRSDLASGLMDRVQNEYSAPMDWGQLQNYGQAPNAQTAPKLQTGLDYSGAQGVQGADQNRQSAEDAIYKSATSRLDPRFAQQEKDLQTRLANQDISQNSDAYRDAMRQFNESKTDAYNQAQLSAITGAGAEAQRNQAMDMGLRQQQVGETNTQGQFGNQARSQMFGFGNTVYNQGMQNANYNNALRGQQLQEQIQKRGFSLNEIQALLNGQQVSMPQFGSYGQAGKAQATDYSGAAGSQYDASMDAYNAKQAGISNMVGGATSAAMMFSDRRVKADIERIGTHPRGFGIYRYRYIGERMPRVGVIAQDVRRFAPELVGSVRGVLQVNYAAL